MKYWEIINDSIPMRTLVEHYGLRPNYANFVCCPFHREKTPSMKIYEKSYYCFGCHTSGKAVNFVMQYFSLDFKTACEKLNEDFHLGLDIGRKLSSYERDRMIANERKRRIEEENARRIERNENGYFEPEEIGKEWVDILYEKVTETQPPLYDLLKAEGLAEYFEDIEEYKKPRITTYRRFKSELVGTEPFDTQLAKYQELLNKKWQEALLNKEIREIESE